MTIRSFCIVFFSLLTALPLFIRAQTLKPGQTEICEWQYGKNGAISLTYDDGNVNQFKYALPIMERLDLPATFFVITGPVDGSVYHGKFIGRPVKEIIAESATVPTSDKNFFERCSAAGYLGFKGTIDYHTRAGSLFDQGKKDHAFKLIDTLYSKVRHGDFQAGYEPNNEVKQATGSTWDEFKADATKGYEFASHSITHPSMPALDEANLLYELEKSKADILSHLGPRYTFAAECPYGFENNRVMNYALRIYPALRNRMPEPYLKEIDRASKLTPGNTGKQYVQWQRGATTKTPLPMMKSWVDTAAIRKDTWLVLVFHGIDNFGYEALPHTLLDEYFQYIKSMSDKVWVATFGDATRYMRERENAKVSEVNLEGVLHISLKHSLDRFQYNLPLTLKTYIPSSWKNARLRQGKVDRIIAPQSDEKGSFVLYQAMPNEEPMILAKA